MKTDGSGPCSHGNRIYPPPTTSPSPPEPGRLESRTSAGALVARQAENSETRLSPPPPPPSQPYVTTPHSAMLEMNS
ncbi:unnamed protein product [Lota lota]